MMIFNGIYEGKKVLVTGHTGFKGSWLTLWLSELGAHVSGISLDPQTSPNHWDLLGLPIKDYRLDIRDFDSVKATIQTESPEIVFHLAAQPLVRRSYRDPLDTWSSNVMGTANVLEAARSFDSVKAIVVVTTDKCYDNKEWHWGYREIDQLGGHDPYSASKAAAELLVESYRKAFFSHEPSPLLASARAGNVIGGGDWSEDRLIPDLVRAVSRGVSLEIRNPRATRPWQHVLESLSAYLLLGQRLLEGDKSCASAWNFGPDILSNLSVKEVLERFKMNWSDVNWHTSSTSHPHEANLLYLDSTKARQYLDWGQVWTADTTFVKTAEWYRAYLEGRTVMSSEQIKEFVGAAQEKNSTWC